MSGQSNSDPKSTEPTVERRATSRTRDDADWESKVIGRLNGRLHQLPATDGDNPPGIGWESSVLDVLRKRIERKE
jgi:hypothetical protein